MRPSSAQSAQLEEWQHLVGYVQNRSLGDRIYSYSKTFVEGAYCDLYTKREVSAEYLYCDIETRAIFSPIHCSVNKSASLGTPWKEVNNSNLRRGKKDGSQQKEFNPKRSAYQMHSSWLPDLKSEKPEYKQVYSNVLQQALRNVDKAFSNFFAGRAEFPNFKSHIAVTFEFTPGDVSIHNRYINFPKLGKMRFFKSREIPETWEIRTVTISRQSDGWYVSILLRNLTVPDIILKSIEEISTIQGADVGIKKLVSLSDGTTIPNPQLFKKFERSLGIRQRRVERKKKGSKNRKKASKQVRRLHQQTRRLRVSRRRSEALDYQWKTAKKIAGGADVTVFEQLKVKNMIARCKPKKDVVTGKYLKNGQKAKSQLNKAISDVSWYSLRIKTEYQASKLGNLVVTVNPRHTSQECSECHHISPDNRDGEKFICEMCGYFCDADVNAATNQAYRGKAKLGIDTLRVVSSKVTLIPESTGGKEITLPLGGVPENPAKLPVRQRQLRMLSVKSVSVESKPKTEKKRRKRTTVLHTQLSLFDSCNRDAEMSTS